MSTSIVSYLTDFSVTLFTKKPMNYLQVVLSCQVREIRRFAVFESRRSKVNWVVTTSACLCLDWGSQAVFPWAGTVKVWITGLFRSQTGRRWYRGKSAVTSEMCHYLIICHIAIAYSMEQIINSICLSLRVSVVLSALSRSHFVVDFRQKWHRGKKNELVGINVAPSLPLFCPCQNSFWGVNRRFEAFVPKY